MKLVTVVQGRRMGKTHAYELWRESTMTHLVSTAFEYARAAHGDQLYGDEPYINHLVRVALPFDNPTLRVIGLLHDVVEDTSATLANITTIFGARVALGVEALTHKKGTSCLDSYIAKVIKNSDAKAVKISDLTDHLYHIDNVYPGRYDKLKPRYLSAWKILTGKEYPER